MKIDTQDIKWKFRFVKLYDVIILILLIGGLITGVSIILRDDETSVLAEEKLNEKVMLDLTTTPILTIILEPTETPKSTITSRPTMILELTATPKPTVTSKPTATPTPNLIGGKIDGIKSTYTDLKSKQLFS